MSVLTAFAGGRPAATMGGCCPSASLGATGPAVSVMSLGSWRTFERISRDEGLAVMQAAREAGVTLLDDARYDDETGQAPIPTGWSEVVFGELFRAAGWDRDAVTVCNKLWWEHWPDEDATTELDGSLERMGLDHVDVIYAIAAPTAPPVEVVVEQVAGLIGLGPAARLGHGHVVGPRASPRPSTSATPPARRTRSPPRCPAASPTTASPAIPRCCARSTRGGIGLVAAYALAGGTLTGKYASGCAPGGRPTTPPRPRRAARRSPPGSPRWPPSGTSRPPTWPSPTPSTTRTWRPCCSGRRRPTRSAPTSPPSPPTSRSTTAQRAAVAALA